MPCFCSCTAAAVYSGQSESIREDLPVLQRLCQATILQNPLKKWTFFSSLFFFLFKPMYTSTGVVIKYSATTLDYLGFSSVALSCSVGVVRDFSGWCWMLVNLWKGQIELLSRCENKERLKSNKCIYWDSLILIQFHTNMYYKGVNWEITEYLLYSSISFAATFDLYLLTGVRIIGSSC